MESIVDEITKGLKGKLQSLVQIQDLTNEVLFDQSWLTSQVIRYLKQPFIRVVLKSNSYSISVIDDSYQVVNSFDCQYDDLEFLDCVIAGEIPSCILDLLLNPSAPKLLWNGIIFVEVSHEGRSETIHTVLKFSHDVLMVYLRSLKTAESKVSKFVLDSNDVDVQFEKEMLVGLNPDLDLEIEPKNSHKLCNNTKNNKTRNVKNFKNQLSFCASRRNLKKLLSSRITSRPLHSINQIRNYKPSRSAVFLRNHPRAMPRKNFVHCSLTKPSQISDILVRKQASYDSLWKTKRASQDPEIYDDKLFEIEEISNESMTGCVIVPEEKHTIEAFGSNHCAEITISRREPDDFFLGELRVIQRSIPNRSNVSPSGSSSASLPPIVMNEKYCRFELGSMMTVEKYIFEYIRMISERDRTPKHTVTYLRKNQPSTL